MNSKTIAFNPAQYLESEEDIALFVSDALSTGDCRHIAHCLGIAARAKGLCSIAKETGLTREQQLLQSFTEDGNPSLKDTLAVMKALGITLSGTPAKKYQSVHKTVENRP